MQVQAKQSQDRRMHPKRNEYPRRSGQNTHSTHSKRDFILFANTYPFVQNIELNKSHLLFSHYRVKKKKKIKLKKAAEAVILVQGGF